jgi:hypothetical protein
MKSGCVLCFMASKNRYQNFYVVRLELKANLHFHNTSHGTVNTKIGTKELMRVFVFPMLKMSLRVSVYKAPDWGFEAENTK